MSKQSIRQDWDWPALLSEVEMQNIVEDGNGNYIQSIFFGTVFSILPSGRYMSGLKKDAYFIEELEAVASEFGLIVISGEHDPCDLFLIKVVG